MARTLSLASRMTRTGVVLLVIWVGVSAGLLAAYRRSVYGEKESAIRQVAEVGAATVRHYVALAEQGAMPVPEAQRRALAELKSLRYSGNEYFWVNDLHPRMVMHPTKPEMDGQDLSSFADPNGKRLFVEMADVCRRAGKGLVAYEWPRASGGTPVPKFSYVVLVPSWGWVVGTGVYVDDIEGQLRVAAAVLGVILGIGVVAGLLVLVYVRRRLIAPLGSIADRFAEGSRQVATAARGVSAGASALSQGATTQAASLEETSASLEEMASMTRKNAESAHEAADQVAETGRLVSGANAALSQLVDSMSAIKESSARVTKIVRTIDEIAFQTNILALNAAVEAARAGEAGMGFAVVADEVRNLAQRSAQAARDTAALIEESAVSAEAGGARVDAVVAAMSAITASSERVRSLVGDVSTASRQQAQGLDQTTQAMGEMERTTQTTAATAEESAASSEELHAQAEQTMALVRELETLVRGQAAAAEPHQATAAGRLAGAASARSGGSSHGRMLARTGTEG